MKHQETSVVLSIVCVILVMTPGIHAQTSYAAQRLDGQVQVNCTYTSSRTGPLYWQYLNRVTGTLVYIYSISINRTWTPISNPNSQYFSPAPNNGANEYNITINSLKANISSQYSCIDPIEASQAVTSNVIGLDAMQCPFSTNPPTTMNEGDNINLNCSVKYYQYTLGPADATRQPGMTWSSESRGIITSEYSADMYIASASVNVTLTATDDNVPFWCNMTFSASQGFAEPYEEGCFTTYYVRHSVSYVDINYDTNSTDGSVVVNVGDVINCTSNGRPVPQYSWLDQQGMVVSNNEFLEITQAMDAMTQPLNYTCRAMNNALGTEVVVEQSIAFYVGTGGQVVQSSGGVEGWVIAVAVVVPLVVIIAAAIGGYFFYRHRKQKKSKKSKTSTRNGSTTYTPVATQPSQYTDHVRPPASQPPASQPTVLPYPTPRSGTSSPGNAAGVGALGVQYYTGSNTNLDASINSNVPANKPAYPYNPRNGTAPAVSMNPNPGARPSPGGPPQYPYQGNRQPSVASSVSSRSSYQGGPPVPGIVPPATNRSVHSSLSGSEV